MKGEEGRGGPYVEQRSIHCHSAGSPLPSPLSPLPSPLFSEKVCCSLISFFNQICVIHYLLSSQLFHLLINCLLRRTKLIFEYRVHAKNIHQRN